MPVLLVRHAIALPRSVWAGDDSARPLNERGRRQADGLVELLAPFRITRILSSPTVRCVDTVAPAAGGLGLEVEGSGALAEGAGPEAIALLDSSLDLDGDTVLCSHGDVVGDVLAHLDRSGARLDDDRRQKGSTWVLGRAADSTIVGRYVAPPE